MMIQIFKIVRLFLIGLLLASIVGCSPFMDKKLRKKKRCNTRVENFTKRIAKKCPDVLKKDTLIIRDTIDAIEIDTFIIIKPDTLGIDSIFDIYKTDLLDSLGQINLKNEIIKYIKSKPCSSDTTIIEIDGITFTFWFTKGRMHYTTFKPQEIKETEIPTITIQPAEYTWLEQARLWLNQFWWHGVILFIVLVIIYGVLKYFRIIK